MKAALRAGGLVVTVRGCGDDIAPLLRRLISHAGGGGIRIEVQLFGGMRRRRSVSQISTSTPLACMP
jgi:hypothetical protein